MQIRADKARSLPRITIIFDYQLYSLLLVANDLQLGGMTNMHFK